MKKLFNFLKKSTIITVLFVFIAGNLMLPGTHFGNVAENSYSTYAKPNPLPDQRPLDNPEHD